jgi:regulator of sirC expression with transglutaminase-like and TPR domain
VRRAALALLLFAACARRAPSSAEAPLARRMLAVGSELGAGSANDAARELERFAARARAELDQRGAASPADVLNRVVFDEESFSREVDDTDVAFALLPSVVSMRRGSCVGLGSLYLALGDLLGVPMRGVVLPGHFFVRVRQGDRWRNVELLRRGEEEPPDWYRARWPTPATTTAVYDRPLSDDEVIGVIEYDAGNDLRRRGRLPEARRAFERAVALFPSLPEAQASLGAVLQLTGALDPALTAYRAAARLEPGLPGLDRNLRLLEEERGSRFVSTTSSPDPVAP